MKWTDLPSLNSLKAFAVLAETGSYSRAGAALNVSHAAVIHQIRLLEDRLGVPLASRAGRGIKLTADGEALAHDLEAGFATIRRGVEALVEAGMERPVQVTMSPAFAIMWLMPRMAEFQTRHPEIMLLLNPTSELMDLKPGGLDLAIRYRARNRLTEKVDSVLIADMVVVGTPALVGEHHVLDPATLLDLPWLQELGTNEVTDWLTDHGVTIDRPLTISHMPGNLIMEAVRRGDGISYTARPFVESELRSGQLVELFCDEAFGVYYIRTGSGVLRPPVRIFVDWLLSMAKPSIPAAGQTRS